MSLWPLSRVWNTNSLFYAHAIGTREPVKENKQRDNVACTERMRSRLLSRLTMSLSLLPVFSEIGVPTYYSIGTLRLSIGPYTKYKEVEHTVQVIK